MQMWAGIQIIKTNPISRGKHRVTVGGIDQERQDKISWNVERFGVFLDPTEDELAQGREAAKEMIDEILRVESLEIS